MARGSRILLVLGSVAATYAGWPATGAAIPGSGPHATVDITATTKRPGASTGLNWEATFRNPDNPAADPPALRRIVIVAPRGTRTDTSAAPQCTATDDQLRESGEEACPAGSEVGFGAATARLFGAVTNTFETTVFNAPLGQIELIKFRGRTGGIRRATIRGRTIDAPVPTCLNGGQPPDGCRSDHIVVLENELHQRPVSVGRGARRRNLITTPPRCPRTGTWRTQVRLHFADGSVDRIVTRQPCSQRRS